MDSYFFTCIKCNLPFANRYIRDKHQMMCLDDTFSTDVGFSVEEVVVEQPPTYRELLAKASEKDPHTYSKYLNRKVITEPNNMIDVYRKTYGKAKYGAEED